MVQNCGPISKHLLSGNELLASATPTVLSPPSAPSPGPVLPTSPLPQSRPLNSAPSSGPIHPSAPSPGPVHSPWPLPQSHLTPPNSAPYPGPVPSSAPYPSPVPYLSPLPALFFLDFAQGGPCPLVTK